MNPLLAIGQILLSVALIAVHPAPGARHRPVRHVRRRLGRLPQPARRRAPPVAVHDPPARPVRPVLAGRPSSSSADHGGPARGRRPPDRRSVNRRDRAVVVRPRPGARRAGRRSSRSPPGRRTPRPRSPRPSSRRSRRVVYREGVVGRARVHHPRHCPQPRRARARRARVLGPRAAGPRHDLPARPRRRPGRSTRPGKTWTFTIRDDAVWQDGQPVTADDVVFTVEALKSPELPAPGPPPGPTSRSRRSTSSTVRLTLGTPIGGVPRGGHAAAPAGPPPRGRAVRGPRHERVRAPARGQRARSRSPTLDDQRATLVPASGVMAPVVEDPAAGAGAPPSMDSLATPLPRPSASLPSPYLDEIELRFFDDAGRARGGHAQAARWTPRRACPPRDSASSPQAEGIDRLRYPTTTLLHGPAQPAAGPQGAPRPEGPRARCWPPSTATRSSRRCSAATPPARMRLVPPTSWAYDATRPSGPSSTTPRRPRRPCRPPAGRRRAGQWVAPGRQGRLRARASRGPAGRRTRAWRRWPRFVAGLAGRRSGSTSRLVEVAGRGAARPGCARATSPPPSWTSPRAWSPTCTRCSRRPRSAPRGSNLAGYQDPALDPLLEAARKPGTPEERTAAWKALLAALAARQPLLPLAWNDEVMLARGPRRGHSAAHRGHRRPLLGCASMAPRRGPVSPRVGRFQVGPRWRNGRRAGFRYQ